jgi:serine/threonine protein phosphatase 1
MSITDSYIAIGDIHGCSNTLEALIEKLPLNQNPHLIFLGDYVDRGPNSRAVIDIMINLQRSYQGTFLMGNHEVMMLDYLDYNDYEPWSINGGEQTLQDYTSHGVPKIPDTHIAFLRRLPFYLDTPEYFFVHGGIKPNRSIAENLKHSAPLDFVWERSQMKADTFIQSHENWEKTVVCGHTPQPEPLLMPKLIAIDTGCVYVQRPGFGKLTAVALPSREIFQVENLDMKHPGWV